jgi:Holliday junction resolvase
VTGAANRRRGADAERAVCAYLRQHGFPDARRYLAGDGNQPGDIDFAVGVTLEVKDRAQSAWPSWRAQALTEARPGDIVAVVRRTRGVPVVGLWPCQVPWDHWRRIEGRAHLANAVACPRTDQMWASMPFSVFADLVAVGR